MEWTTTVDSPGSTYLMQGNEAVVRGAVEAGIRFASSYPGSPSSQVLAMLGNIAEKRGFYAEWSTNEVCALESCLGASFAGARSLCIVKQNGLLVLADALHCGALSGVRAGLVLITSDDPSAHSSTNEFDSRHMAVSASVPMLEPSSIQETKDIIPYAFELSEKLRQIVVVRLTTRVCHGRGNVTVGNLPDEPTPFMPLGKWDRMVCVNYLHEYMLETLDNAREQMENMPFTHYDGAACCENIIITEGTGRKYCLEALELRGIDMSKTGLLSLGSIWPLPEKLILSKLKNAKRVLVVEEVDPFLERNIAAIAGKNKLQLDIFGRDGGELLPRIGELDPENVDNAIAGFFGLEKKPAPEKSSVEIADRELTFCAGCPHRASFYLLKQALALDEIPGVAVGDIGCYTMAGQRAGQYGYQFMNCMGSGVNAASGIGHLRELGFNQPVFTVAGDSTFFHSCIPGLVNAKFNNADMLFIVLDNSATAMTGFQPHPGTGITAMGKRTEAISIEKIVEAIGCSVTVADPFDIDETTKTVHKLMNEKGLKVLILRQQCATLAAKTRAKRKVWVDTDICRGDDCGCGRLCTRVWGCPGNSWDFKSGKAVIDTVQCVGCGVCAKLCPSGAIKIEGGEEK